MERILEVVKLIGRERLNCSTYESVLSFNTLIDHGNQEFFILLSKYDLLFRGI